MPDDTTNSDAPKRDAIDAAGWRDRLRWDDADLLHECEVHAHRVSGPGGQHRNKVSSAIRLRHRPTGFVVTATERRSQHENRANALKRLREAIAIGLRRPLPTEIMWPESVQIRDQRLKVSVKNAAYWDVLALALDALAAADGRIGDAAKCLRVTTSSLTRFLADNSKAWTEANRIRAAHDLPPLKA